MKRSLISVILLLFSILSFGKVVNGLVYVDKNGNGIRESSEKGLEGVVLSDGFSIVKSDKNGEFSINTAEKARFITLYTPSYYSHSTPFYLKADSDCSAEFGLVEDNTQNGKFIQMADIEERQYLNWYDDFKHFVKYNKVDFVAVTGDICYENGLKLNGRDFNSEKVGTRMVFTLGNHDLIKGNKDALGNDYGEKLFEDNFGPVWYSFNSAGVHYVVTPMLSGDAQPSYTPEEIFSWMRADFATLKEGTPIVLFGHTVMKGLFDLSPYNVIAYIYGHHHINYHYQVESGTRYFCSVAPNKGGNDHAPSSFRIFSTTNNGSISNELHYTPIKKNIAASVVKNRNGYEVVAVAYDGVSIIESVSVVNGSKEVISLVKANDMLWRGTVSDDLFFGRGELRVKALCSDGSLIFSDLEINDELDMQVILKGKGFMGKPIIDDQRLIVPMIDDEMSDNCGICAIDKNSGDVLWCVKTTGSIRNDMVFEDGVVYAADVNSMVYALDSKNGKEIWKKDCNKKRFSTLYSQGLGYSDGVIYMGSGSSLCAINAADGSLIWENKAWSGGITDVSTFVEGNGVLIGNGYWSGRYANDALTGELKWQKKDPKSRYSTAKPAFVDNHFIYTTLNSIMEVDAQTGEDVLVVDHPHQFNTRSTPTIYKDSILIVGTSNHGMAAFDRKTFTQIWNYTTNPSLIYTSPYTKSYEQSIEGSPVLYGDKVIFGANDGYLYCVTAEKGTYVWRYWVGLPILADPVIDGEYLYVVDMGGRVIKLRPDFLR